MAKQLAQKDVVGCFFDIHPTLPDTFVCFCDKEKSFKQQVKSGYTNLMNHIKSKHAGYESRVSEIIKAKRTGNIKAKKGRSYRQLSVEDFVDQKALTTHNWLRLLIKKNLPLTFCEDIEFKECLNSDFTDISYKTLKKRMYMIVKSVENTIKEKLNSSGNIALIFDGWTERSNHYLGVFAATPKNEPLLLAFAPFLNEQRLNADEHIIFLDFILDLYAIDASKICCIVADNTNTNKSVANKMRVPFCENYGRVQK